jgi:hypothetical protein
MRQWCRPLPQRRQQTKPKNQPKNQPKIPPPCLLPMLRLPKKHTRALRHPSRTQAAKTRQPQHQPLWPSPPNRWSLFVATTGPDKSAQKRQLAVTVDATHVLVSAVRDQELTAARAEAETVLQTVRRVVISAKNAVHVWVTPLSAPNARPWSGPKCPCANWPHRPTAKP